VWSPGSCVKQLSALAHAWCAEKVKIVSSLTDVWQQLFEQQNITSTWMVHIICTIHFHSWLNENHTSAPEPETDTQEYVYQKPVRYVDELKWHLIETWSAFSTASLIKRLSVTTLLMCVSKPKANTINIFYYVFLCNCHDC